MMKAGFSGTPRPTQGFRHASTQLENFAMISYRCDPQVLLRHLPDGFTPSSFSFSDGGPDALISAVVFFDRDFCFRWAPILRLSCGQVNYRAYVRFGNIEGVWFFGTSLDHWTVAYPRHRWKMPWFRDRISIEADWRDEQLNTWKFRAKGWGNAQCQIIGSRSQTALHCDGFANESELLKRLLHPLDGWVDRRDGSGISHYSVWHPAFAPQVCDVVGRPRFSVFERAGLIGADSVPHSAFAQRRIWFDVHTPPTRLLVA
jgi:hypothetical protein